jgi:hypothetical protein
MLDPVVRSKIHMTKTIDDLCVFVDKSKLWRSLGGENAWEYKYVPFVPGENKTMEDTQTRDVSASLQAAGEQTHARR